LVFVRYGSAINLSSNKPPVCAPRGGNGKKEKSNSHFFARSDAKALPAVNTGKLISFSAYKCIVMTSCHSRYKPRSQWVCHIFYTACIHSFDTSFTPCKTHLPFANHKTKPTIRRISRSASCNNLIVIFARTKSSPLYKIPSYIFKFCCNVDCYIIPL